MKLNGIKFSIYMGKAAVYCFLEICATASDPLISVHNGNEVAFKASGMNLYGVTDLRHVYFTLTKSDDASASGFLASVSELLGSTSSTEQRVERS